MNRIVTSGIVLTRLNFGEADKIITLLTPDHGKIRVLAKGVRKVKSKLAGGIELFCISSITFIPGRRDIGTLVSTRLVTHYSHIIESLERTIAAYDVLKLINKSTEDKCEEAFFHLLVQVLSDLNNPDINVELIKAWFYMRLLDLLGHRPNLQQTVGDEPLNPKSSFNFDFEAMGFFGHSAGKYTANDIKLLRLLLNSDTTKLSHIKDIGAFAERAGQLLHQAIKQSLH